MKNMKKQILLRSAIGFPIGVCVSSLIILVISFCIGTYAPCSPGCTALFGSETAGATAQFLLSGLVGSVFAGSSVIWEVESWSLFRATATHFCMVTPLFWVVSLLLGWCDLSLWGMLLYLGIFLCIYLSIWLSQYSVYRRKIQKINQKLQEDTNENAV